MVSMLIIIGFFRGSERPVDVALWRSLSILQGLITALERSWARVRSKTKSRGAPLC